MQLTAFRIFKYRNIEDSGLVTLADRLTCIVGKNQSGKTNLLRGLHKFNPHDKSVKYDARSIGPGADGGPRMTPRLYAKLISTWTPNRTSWPV
jgi:ABC-type cobalamin/Fe3+-siderophores transport system ATPase subunit